MKFLILVLMLFSKFCFGEPEVFIEVLDESGSFSVGTIHGKKTGSLYTIYENKTTPVIVYPNDVYVSHFVASKNEEVIILNMYKKTQQKGTANFFGVVLLEKKKEEFVVRQIISIGSQDEYNPLMYVRGFEGLVVNREVKALIAVMGKDGKYDFKTMLLNIDSGLFEKIND